MRSYFDVVELTRLFRAGTNLMQTLRDRQSQAANNEATILYSYDVQSGSYVRALEGSAYLESKKRLSAHLASVIAELKPRSLLDAGTGEATTLGHVLQYFEKPPPVFAFDISLSRILYAKTFLKSIKAPPFSLFTSALENIALADGCCDVVFTCHALEPNGGSELDIMREMLRVTGRYLVLLEPSWELGSDATKERIERHGYVKDLPNVLRSLGATIERHELWPFNQNTANEAALIVAKVPEAHQVSAQPELRSPIGGGRLDKRGTYLHSLQDGFVFPLIEEIPCLLAENGILASRLDAALAYVARAPNA